MQRAYTIVLGAVLAVGLVASLRGGVSGERAPARAPETPAALQGMPEQFLAKLLQERYGVPGPLVARALRSGSSAEEVLLAANLSARVGRPLPEVLEWRRKGEDWNALARRYGLEPGSLIEPASAPLAEGDETLFRELLCRKYRMTEMGVARLRRDGFPALEILAAAELCGGGDAVVAEALVGRRQGRAWADVAGRRAGAPGDSGHPAGAGSGEVAPFYQALLSERYGVAPSETQAAVRSGMAWADLPIAANVAARAGRPFAEIVRLRAESPSWQAVERRLGLAPGAAMQPAPAPQQRAPAGATAPPPSPGR